MSAFPIAVALVIELEGGDKLISDPHDPGGLTKYGISAKANPDLDVRNLTRIQAEEIYRARYWVPLHGDEMPGPLALVLFDAAVNVGIDPAIQMLQIALGVRNDGILGPETLAAARRAVVVESVLQLTCRRVEYYQRIVENRPASLRYLRGWWLRCLRVLVHASVIGGIDVR
jgi:lysozyme family protein